MLSNLKNQYQRKIGKRDQIQTQIEQTEDKLKSTKKQLKINEWAKNITRTVALETQSQLEYHIANTVSAAQQVVFDNPYELIAKFEEKRGKTECNLLFQRDDQQRDPVGGSGYGTVDVAAFALRVSSWSMSRRTRPMLLLDEPFKHLKGIEENRRVIAMMKEVSKELGLQIITISDERAPREDIIEGADRVFEVSIKNRVSNVQQI